MHDAQDPQEQVDKKTAKAQRLTRELPKLNHQLRDKQAELEVAEQKVRDLAEEEAKILQKHREHQAEIERLNSETFSLGERLVHKPPTDAEELFKAEVAQTTADFDHLILWGDGSVEGQKAAMGGSIGTDAGCNGRNARSQRVSPCRH